MDANLTPTLVLPILSAIIMMIMMMMMMIIIIIIIITSSTHRQRSYSKQARYNN